MSATDYVEEKLAPGLIERRYPSGKTVYRSSVYADGQRYFQKWDGLTRTEAKARHRKHENEVKDQGLRPALGLTLGELREQAFAHFESLITSAGSNGQRLRVGASALGNYRTAWAKRITPYTVGRKSIDDVKLGDIDRKLVRDWLAWLAKTGVAPSTQNGTLSAIRTVLRYARDNDLMVVDPFAAVPTEERPSQRPRAEWDARVLSAMELRRVCSAAHSPEFVEATPGVLLTHAIEVLVYSGLRLSELLGLRWGDVDLVTKVLTVREQRARHLASEAPSTAQTKSHRSVRSFAMPDLLYEALIAQLAHEESKGRGAAEQFVFTTTLGTALNVEHVKGAVRRATKQAGLGVHGPQVLRRSFATQVAHARISSIEAEAMLGHSAATFESNYAKPIRDAEQMAANRSALASIGFGRKDAA